MTGSALFFFSFFFPFDRETIQWISLRPLEGRVILYRQCLPCEICLRGSVSSKMMDVLVHPFPLVPSWRSFAIDVGASQE
jgi:hypothetical protein